MTHKLFIMNFGSTSTKVAVFEDEKELAKETLRHSQDVLNQFENVIAQKDFRKEAINEFLKNNNYKLDEFDCIVRGPRWRAGRAAGCLAPARSTPRSP